MASADLPTDTGGINPAVVETPTAKGVATTSKSSAPVLRSTPTVRSRSASSASATTLNGPVVGFGMTSGTGLSAETIQRSGRGRSSRAAAAALLASDTRYKRYAQAIDRCLSTFDTVAEWADFIAFLSRLLKTIQSAQPPFSEIPYKLIIAKRLAQGLNPALPNGVHQKSLEVYREILRSIGIDGLKRDLQVWTPGLFPFFQSAATGLKPTLLDLYESFYIPLGKDLRPVAKSMALALLPGIEEETGDYFDRTLDLLTKLANSVDTGFFYQCLFLIMVTNASSRLAAVHYLSRRLKPRLSESEMGGTAGLAEIIGSDTGLLVRGLAAGLDDDTVLVRRGVLDLLIAILPLHKMPTSNVNSEGQRQLMSAACSIVLRRDLSLNKRLYIWLLGPSDEAEKQAEYFQLHTLSTLTEALAGDMAEATLPAQTKDMNTPFKVYIALLDKWEIGYPLSEALALRALETLRDGIETLKGSNDATFRIQGNDLLLTAHTLYEASEPHIIWSNFYRFICQDFEPDIQAKENVLHMDIIIWVLNSFRIHDDEVLLVHVPLLLGRVMQFVQDRVNTNGIPASEDSPIVQSALEVALLLANIVPRAAFNDSSTDSNGDVNANGLRAADKIYQAAEQNLGSFYLGGHAYFALLFKCVMDCFRPLKTATDATVISLASICQRLVATQREDGEDQHLSWDSAEWIQLVAELAQQRTSFEVLQALVSTLVILSDCLNIRPSVAVDSLATLRPLIISAFDKLESHSLDIQPAIVALIWQLHDLRPGYVLATIVCERLGAGDRTSQTRAMNAFGTLWRLTDESHNPGTVLYRPALMILGFLRHENLVLKRAAETWMRCYLRSAFRILDPLLVDLLNDDLRTKSHTLELAEHHITVPRYICRVDFDRCRVLLEVTLNLIEIGGHTMQRACIGTAVKDTANEQLLPLVTADAELHQGSSYTDMIVGLCTRLASTQPSNIDTRASTEANAGVQSAAIQILQVLVGRGDIGVARLRKVESSLVDQLFVCIHTNSLDIQNQLLHLLHSVILAIAAGEAAQREQLAPSTMEDPRVGERNSRISISELSSPLLLRVLQDGIVVKSNRCLLQFWVDFILMTIPHLVGNLQSLSFPLCDTICKEIDSAASTWQNALHGSAAVTEAEVVMLLSCLERVVLTAMSWSHLHTDKSMNQKASAEAPGLFGYVSNVFQADVPMSAHSPLRMPGVRCLRTAVSTLVLVWQNGSGSANGPLARCTSRCRKMCERLFQNHEDEVLSAIVECAVSDEGAMLYPSAPELLELLSSGGAQDLVKRLCESLTATLIATPKTGDSGATIHQKKLLHFLLEYFETLEGPIVVQSWPPCLNLAKAAYTNASNVVPDILLLFLRFFTKFGVLVSTTPALGDKRMRKDWQDSYSKLLDSVLVTAGRGAFAPSRPSTPKLPSVPSVNGSIEKAPLRRISKENLQSTRVFEDVLDRLCQLLASEVIPHLRDLLIDTERVQTACGAIAQHVLQPAFKARPRYGDVDGLALDILLAMSRLTTVQKHWRTYVSEAFADGTVFQASQATRLQWKQLVAVMMDQERERLLDLLNRVAAPPSANIFANRELEMQQRCLNLRRLSLVVFAASHNHFIVQLPGIQERLVDLLRTSSVSSAVHSEVYLCLRVLLCRFSSQHLVNLWPIILSELIKTFEQTMDNIPEQKTETLHLLLSACKLLDLMMVMQTEDFQIHQWLFVTDTPDAQDPPDGWVAEAIMDRLAELVSEHYHADSSAAILRYPVSHQGSRPRRPMLMQVKDIGSLLELEPFFSQASISAYSGMYNGKSVDWEYVESAMEREIFERS